MVTLRMITLLRGRSMRYRIQLLEATFTTFGGLLLFSEICRAVRANVWWMSEVVLLSAIFAVYVWASIGLSLLFITTGVLTLRQRDPDFGFLTVHAPLCLLLLTIFIWIADHWRIQTDVAPQDGISSISELPLRIRALADPIFSAVILAIIGVCALAVIAHALSNRPGLLAARDTPRSHT